jgi:hypothetical protein
MIRTRRVAPVILQRDSRRSILGGAPSTIVLTTRATVAIHSFAVLAHNNPFALLMRSDGSQAPSSALACCSLLPRPALLPILAMILVLAAIKIWQHKKAVFIRLTRDLSWAS